MKYKTTLLVAMTLVSSVSFAKRRHHKRQEKPSAPFKYYYTAPVEASTEWSYTVPDCQPVSREEYKFLNRKDNCQDNSELKAQTCLSRIDVDLKNTKTNEKKKSGLNYVIFDSMKACEETRAKLVAAPAAGTPATAPEAAPSTAAAPAAGPAKQ